MGLLCLTYTINSVDEGIVTAVAHSQPMATKEDYVDVSVAEKDEGKFVSVSSRTKMESLFFFLAQQSFGYSHRNGCSFSQRLCMLLPKMRQFFKVHNYNYASFRASPFFIEISKYKLQTILSHLLLIPKIPIPQKKVSFYDFWGY